MKNLLILAHIALALFTTFHTHYSDAIKAAAYWSLLWVVAFEEYGETACWTFIRRALTTALVASLLHAAVIDRGQHHLILASPASSAVRPARQH